MENHTAVRLFSREGRYSSKKERPARIATEALWIRSNRRGSNIFSGGCTDGGGFVTQPAVKFEDDSDAETDFAVVLPTGHSGYCWDRSARRCVRTRESRPIERRQQIITAMLDSIDDHSNRDDSSRLCGCWFVMTTRAVAAAITSPVIANTTATRAFSCRESERRMNDSNMHGTAMTRNGLMISSVPYDL